MNEQPGTDVDSTFDNDHRPTLYRDRSFWGMVITQFLGAFNDNLFKQLLLLLSIVVLNVALHGGDILKGHVEDEKGSRVALADVSVLREGNVVASTRADADGEFSVKVASGRTYHVQASGGDMAIRTSSSSSMQTNPQDYVAVVSGSKPKDLQWIAMLVFALPFLLFSGYAGFLSDRFSKRRVIVLSKMAEIVVMLLGMAAFALHGVVGLAGAMVVLFLMGMQSAFFGPGKYGILPEMLRARDLPRANGFILMTTFLAIILGQAVGGFLSDSLAGRLWIVSGLCVVIAVIGTATSLLIRWMPPARPDLRFELAATTVPHDMRRLLRGDRPLLMALVVSSTFWLVAGVANSAVNSLGKIQLQQDDFWTSILLVCIGVGIATGAVLAGRLSRGKANFRVVRVGVWGMLACLLLTSLPGIGRPHLLGYTGTLPTLVLLGMFAGMFAIPIQVFLQTRPPKGQKGRMIAVMNQANFAAILLASPVYLAFDQLVVWLDLPRSAILAFTAFLLLPVAVFYQPKSDERG
jgi:MFS family permease